MNRFAIVCALVMFLVRCSGGGIPANAVVSDNAHYMGRYVTTTILIDGIQHELAIDTTKAVTQPEPGLYHTDITLDGTALTLELRKPIAAGHYYVKTKDGRLLFELDTGFEKEDKNIHFYLRGEKGVMFGT